MSVEKMVEDAAKKVAEEGFAGEYEEGDDWAEEEEVPQHVIDEAKVDAALERMRDQRQHDMYNSEDWNWSGFR